MSIFSAMQELGISLRAIQPIMTDAKELREKKRRTLNMMVNELSEDTFKRGFVINQIMPIINMKEEICKEYTDTEGQVEGILRWLPRMRKHQDKLKKEVNKHRKKFGLKT